MSTTRRNFLAAGALVAPTLLRGQEPGIITSEQDRPQITHGVMAGDVAGGEGTIWSRADRPARMIVEYSYSETFDNVTRILGPHCLDVTDYTGVCFLAICRTAQTFSTA